MLSESFLALLLMNYVNIDNNQSFSLLASASPKEKNLLTGYELKNVIIYNQIASILKSSDAPLGESPYGLKAYSSAVKTEAKKTIEERKTIRKFGKHFAFFLPQFRINYLTKFPCPYLL